jgi:hypothetical protein
MRECGTAVTAYRVINYYYVGSVGAPVKVVESHLRLAVFCPTSASHCDIPCLCAEAAKLVRARRLTHELVIITNG